MLIVVAIRAVCTCSDPGCREPVAKKDEMKGQMRESASRALVALIEREKLKLRTIEVERDP